MTTQQFIQKVQTMRQLQARYFLLSKEGKATAATSMLADCNRAEAAVDAAIPVMLQQVESDNMPKLF